MNPRAARAAAASTAAADLTVVSTRWSSPAIWWQVIRWVAERVRRVAGPHSTAAQRRITWSLRAAAPDRDAPTSRPQAVFVQVRRWAADTESAGVVWVATS